MGARGPVPKPTALKVLEGTFRPDRAPKHEATPHRYRRAPKCPATLEGVAREKWRQIAPRLVRLGLLAEIDVDALEQYCLTYELWHEARALVRLEGLTIETPNGYKQPHPGISIAKQCRADLRALAAQFGMTPAARTRVEAQVETDGDPLTRFLEGKE